MEEGAFACTGGSDNGNFFSVGYLNIYTFEYAEIFIAGDLIIFDEVLGLN